MDKPCFVNLCPMDCAGMLFHDAYHNAFVPRCTHLMPSLGAVCSNFRVADTLTCTVNLPWSILRLSTTTVGGLGVLSGL